MISPTNVSPTNVSPTNVSPTNINPPNQPKPDLSIPRPGLFQNPMVLKIRLARFGKRNAPFYNIVVAQARTARNSKPLEVLGTYDPVPKPPPSGEGKAIKDIKLDTSRAKYWLGVGAQPSDPAWRLLSMIGLLEPKYRGQRVEEEEGR
ncbi:37S ribosomal protein S16, mitochondrial [Xanthoria calcicola]